MIFEGGLQNRVHEQPFKVAHLLSCLYIVTAIYLQN
jgi:hypothetical protein